MLESWDNMAAPEDQVQHNYVLAIAIDQYVDDDLSDLRNCLNDAEEVIDALTNHYFFLKENIRFLRSRKDTDDTEERDKIKEWETGFGYLGDATHENIIAQLRNLAKEIKVKVKKNDGKKNANVIVFFSGHGIYDEIFDEGYWIPADAELGNNATYIENGTIRTALNAIDSHHTVLISDSCFSGSLFSSGAQRAVGLPRVYKHASRWGLTAGRRNQTVSDGPGDNSPFSEQLVGILNRKQEVWIGDLCKDLVEALEQDEKQTPMGEPLTNMKGHDGGQFVFMPRLATEDDHWQIAMRENTRKAYYTFLARYPNGKYEQVALGALNKFAAQDEGPRFGPEELKTFDLLLTEIPDRAISFVEFLLLPGKMSAKVLGGQQAKALKEPTIRTYDYLLQHLQEKAKEYLTRAVFKSNMVAAVGSLSEEEIAMYERLTNALPDQAKNYLEQAAFNFRTRVPGQHKFNVYMDLHDKFPSSVMPDLVDCLTSWDGSELTKEKIDLAKTHGWNLLLEPSPETIEALETFLKRHPDYAAFVTLRIKRLLEGVEPMPPPSLGTFTDSRDKRVYRTVVINNLEWLAENLAFDDGTFGHDFKAGVNEYKLGAARKACPEGWRFPTHPEWEELLNKVGEYALCNPHDSGFNLHPTEPMAGQFWYDDGGDNGHGSYHFYFEAAKEFPTVRRNNVSRQCKLRCVRDDASAD